VGTSLAMIFNNRLLISVSAGGIAAIAAVFGFGCRPNAGSATTLAALAEATPVKHDQSVVAASLAESGPLKITWEALDIGMAPDSLFEPWMMTTRVKSLEGKQVRIVGYMSGAIFQKDHVREFPLLREKECPFGPGGQAHHVIEVELQGKLRTSFTTEPVVVEGIFSIQPRTGPNGNTWSLYRLEATKIE